MSNSVPGGTGGDDAGSGFNFKNVGERWITFCKNRIKDFLIDRSVFCVGGSPMTGTGHEVDTSLAYAKIPYNLFTFSNGSNIVLGLGEAPPIFKDYLYNGSGSGAGGMVGENINNGFVDGSGSGRIIELGLSFDMSGRWLQFIPNHINKLSPTGSGAYSYPSSGDGIGNALSPLVPFETLVGSGGSSRNYGQELEAVCDINDITYVPISGSGAGSLGFEKYFFGQSQKDLYLNLYSNVAQCFGYIAYMNKLLENAPPNVGVGTRITSCSWDNEGNHWPESSSYVMIILKSGLSTDKILQMKEMVQEFNTKGSSYFSEGSGWLLMQANASHQYGFVPLVGPLKVNGIWEVGANAGSGEQSTMPAAEDGKDCGYYVLSVNSYSDLPKPANGAYEWKKSTYIPQSLGSMGSGSPTDGITDSNLENYAVKGTSSHVEDYNWKV